MDICTDSIQSTLNIFIAAVDLVDMVDTTGALSRHSGNKHSNTGANIRGCHIIFPQSDLMVMAYNNGSMGVTKDNLCAHINQFIHKKEAALKHFLMYQHSAFCLSGNDEYYREQIGSETRPWCIGYR